MDGTTQQEQGKHNPNPTGKGGFGEHPENISPGGWDKTQSISYQYNRILRMNDEERIEFKPNTGAEKIALARVKAAEGETGLGDAKEIADRTEGKAPQAIDLTTGGDKINAYSNLSPDELRKLAGS